MKNFYKAEKRLLTLTIVAFFCLAIMTACAQQERVSETESKQEITSSTPEAETPAPPPEPTPDARVKIKSSTKYEDVYGTDVSLRDALLKAFQPLGEYQSSHFATVIESEMLAWVAKADQQHKGDGMFTTAVLSPGTRAVNDEYSLTGSAVAQYYRTDTDFVNIEMEFTFMDGPGLIYFNKVEVGNLPDWESVYSYNVDDGPYEYIGNYTDTALPRMANEDSMSIWSNMQMAAARSWSTGYTDPEPVQTELSGDKIWEIWTSEMASLITEWKKQMNSGVPYNSQIDRTSYNSLFPNYEYSETMVTFKTKVNYWFRFRGGDPAGYVNATVKIDKYTGEIISSYIQ